MLKIFNKKSKQTYQDLPDHSRVWVYQSNRAFTDDESEAIRAAGVEFAAAWSSHGADLLAAVEVFHNRFVVIFLDESQAAASGCSIDSSVGFVRNLQTTYHIDLLDRLTVAYNQNGSVQTCSMDEFRAQLKAGTLSAETLVYNNLVTAKGDWTNGWLVPVSASWHKQLLP